MSNEFQSARVVIVDDLPFSREKLRKALERLGLQSTYAQSGREAKARFEHEDFDLVLLDLVMPDMDGFEVLRHMGADKRLREIPVLVVSSSDDAQDVAKALELGAVDFLPKVFDPAIFKARVFGTLEKKRLRDIELAYIDDVARLTQAADLVRLGHISSQQLGLSEVARRNDDLGNLARMFAKLSEAVHQRERAARLRINLLQGSLLLLIMGVSWGVVPTLSKLMIGPVSLPPLGVAAWVATVTVSITGVVMIILGKRPRFTMPRLRFGLITGLFAGVLPQSALFLASPHVPGVVLSITLALESLIVFSIAAALRIEQPSLFRFCGLFLGLVAVVLIVMTSGASGVLGSPAWVLVVMVVPLCYAIQSILVAGMPDDAGLSPIELLFFIMLGSSLWGWSGAWLSGTVLVPGEQSFATLLLIVAIGSMSAISNGSYVLTIRRMGAVFASQYAYVVTIMGLGWAVLLLDERLTLALWISLLLVLFGIFVVRPKGDTETIMSAVTEDVGQARP
ncbi:MAG: response regulator [Pseudomonadota bacterium]